MRNRWYFVAGALLDAIGVFELFTGTAKVWDAKMWGIFSREVVLVGLFIVGTGLMLFAISPTLVWSLNIPKRRAERKRAEELQEREATLELLRTVRDEYIDEFTTVIVLGEPQELPEGYPTKEAVSIAKEKLVAKGLQPPPRVSWNIHAETLIPLVAAYGVRCAKRKVAERYPKPNSKS